MSYDSHIEHISYLKGERDEIILSHSVVSLNWSRRKFSPGPTTRHSVLSISKPKFKTRPENSTYSQISEAPESQVGDAISPPTIQVKPKSSSENVSLKNIWGSPLTGKARSQQRRVLASLIQSVGSAVTFIKEGKDRMVFHKAHPIAKIDRLYHSHRDRECESS